MEAAGILGSHGIARRRGEIALRVVSAVALAIPAAFAIVAGPPYVTVFVAALAAILAWEWVRVCGAAVYGITGAVLTLALVLAVFLATYAATGWGIAAVLAAAAAVWAVARGAHRAHALWLGAGALYIGAPALALVWLQARPEAGWHVIVWVVAVVSATDMGAYFVGRTVGGPRLAPRISPGKTWSGLAGGLVCAALAGAGLGLALGRGTAEFLVVAALLLGAVSQIGDLFESAIKRFFRVKDASGLMPGHGGLMDRVDGQIAALVAAALAIWLAGGESGTWL